MSFFNKPKEESKKGKKVETKQKKPLIKKEESSEGELAIDVYETKDEIIVQSTIAGIKAEDLDISIENDLVTIRGSRQKQKEDSGENYLYQECYWGAFSRQVILPEEVDGSKAQAKIKDGVLTLRIPKIQSKKKRKITVKSEE
ncbi:MAG: Hsp20/alpha crystallin family protein [Candidatus Nealsonbacteria bacterium]